MCKITPNAARSASVTRPTARQRFFRVGIVCLLRSAARSRLPSPGRPTNIARLHASERGPHSGSECGESNTRRVGRMCTSAAHCQGRAPPPASRRRVVRATLAAVCVGSRDGALRAAACVRRRAAWGDSPRPHVRRARARRGRAGGRPRRRSPPRLRRPRRRRRRRRRG